MIPTALGLLTAKDFSINIKLLFTSTEVARCIDIFPKTVPPEEKLEEPLCTNHFLSLTENATDPSLLFPTVSFAYTLKVYAPFPNDAFVALKLRPNKPPSFDVMLLFVTPPFKLYLTVPFS